MSFQTKKLIYLLRVRMQPVIECFLMPALAEAVIKKGDNAFFPLKHYDDVPEQLKTHQDHDLFDLLSALEYHEEGYCLSIEKGIEILEMAVQKEACYFNEYKIPLRMGKKRYGVLEWIKQANNLQKLQCRVSGGASIIIALDPLWYIDAVTHECGELAAPLDAETAKVLLASPGLDNNEMQEIYTHLKNVKSEKESLEIIKKYFLKKNQPLEEKNIQGWYLDWKSNPKEKNWFEVEMGIEYQDEKINILPLLAEAVRQQLLTSSVSSIAKLPDEKIIYIDLPNQKKFPFTAKRLKKILNVFSELYTQENFYLSNRLKLSAGRVFQIASLKDELNLSRLHWEGDIKLNVFLKKFEEYKKNHFDNLPSTFLGELRYYQQQGVHWLQFLREIGFSGVLADDMGLGKTIQLLAHLSIEKHHRRLKHPCLIISPTSLVMNWKNEILKFAPHLKLVILHGQERKNYYGHISKADIVLSTYALLTRDAEMFCQYEYQLLVLDEAQYIKNIHSKAGAIARQLNSSQRLCMTGTPLENHLNELWSLFDFLMPGLLGDQKQFKNLFRDPIEKQQDVTQLKSLQERISPFFLRRTKKEVLKELPEKIEILQTVILTESQQELYENIRIALHKKVLNTIESQGIARSQIYILAALLRLRQICCDPRLLKKTQNAFEEIHSAKMQLLNDLLPQLISEGRKILLFSQFTEMLALIEEMLKNLNIKYVKLTGSTQNREEVIQQFQETDTPLFLISLKAGGVGLNLTAADTVIHYDPWWNPAVENQATDRAYRLGQDKTVFVYKLITAGTIEEKILNLQQKKQSLLDSVIQNTDENNFQRFSMEDIKKLFEPLVEE